MKAAQSCPTLCNPMDYSPPGSSVHGSLQEIILRWVAIPFSKGSDLGIEPGSPAILYHLNHQGSPKGIDDLICKAEMETKM